MAFIGNTVQTQGFTPAIDYFNGNGVTVTFTLSRPVASVAQMIVAIDNVIQNPSSAFNVSGNAITFTSAPLSGTNNIWVEYTSLITTYQGISQDPSVIGDITATGGFLSTGDFGNSFIDGAVIDYVTGAGRITVGELDNLIFYHGGTSGRSEMMKLSYAGSSYVIGNLGVNVTPSAWGLGSGGSALQISGGALSSYTNSNLTVAQNTYFNGSDWKYVNTAGATIYQQVGSVHAWSTAASGTAGTTTTLTERMRIDSDGTVIVGTGAASSGSTTFGVKCESINGAYATVKIGRGNFAAYGEYKWDTTNDAAVWTNNGTQIMRITSNGCLMYGTGTTQNQVGSISFSNTSDTASYGAAFYMNTGYNGTRNAISFGYNSSGVGAIVTGTSNTSYNTSSDYRLKDNPLPLTGSGAFIDALKPKTWTWKVDGKAGVGFIAHEAQEVAPQSVHGEKDAVDADNKPIIQSMEYGSAEFIANMVAELQDLRKRVAALEAK
jgi:hypothetical protein